MRKNIDGELTADFGLTTCDLLTSFLAIVLPSRLTYSALLVIDLA